MAKKNKKYVLDASVLAMSGMYPETSVTFAEKLEQGNKAEIRDALYYFGVTLKNNGRLKPEYEQWLGEALIKIRNGDDPKKAFGLNTKRRYGVQDIKNLRYMVKNLRKQGLTKDEALDVVAHFSYEEMGLVDRDEKDPVESLKQLLKRKRNPVICFLISKGTARTVFTWPIAMMVINGKP